jgi:sensor histidine kinase YesM
MFSSRVFISLCFILLSWFTLHTLVLVQSGVTYTLAALDAVLFSVLTTGAAWIVGTVIRFYRPNGTKLLGLLACNVAIAWAIVLIYEWISPHLTGPGNRITDLSIHATLMISVVGFLVICLYAMTCWLWISIEEREAEIARKNEAQRLLQEAELSVMKQQLQPHFLFNALNSVNALVTTKPQEARHMIQLLSDFLRGTLRKDFSQKITLKEELIQLNRYLEIEQVRFANRLKFNLIFPAELGELELPALLLQPLIENAIKHGLYGTSANVEIEMQISKPGNMLEIRIDNPVDADTRLKPTGSGFGLESIQRRLLLIYARSDLFSFKIEHNRYYATLRIPQK